MAETDTIQDTGVDSPPQTPPQTPPPQQPPDKVRALYDAVSHDYDLGDFNTFKQKLQDPEKQKAFYNGVGKDYDLGTFDDFSKKVSGNRQPSGFSETSGIGLDNERQKAVENAPAKLQNIVSSPAYSKAAESLNAQQYGKQLRDAQEKYQNGDINEDQYNQIQSQLVTAGFNAKNQVGQTVESSKNDEQLMRKILVKTKDQNKDKNPQLVKDINSTAQLIDQQNLDPQKVWELNKKINSGQVGYDLNLKRPTYDPGVVGNFMLELKNHFKTGDKANFLTTAPKDQIIAEEEKSRIEGAKNDPFTPVPKGQGWSSVSGTIGANAIPMAEGFGASAAVGAADYLSGGATIPLLSPILGATFMSLDASKQALANTFEQVYHDERNNGKTPDEAYETAMQQGKFNSVASAVQMGAMSFIGLKTANKPLFGGIWGKPLKQFIAESAPKVLPSLQKVIPEVAGQATLAGMTKAVENINAGKPVGTDVGNEIAGTAAFLGALHLLGTGSEVLTKRGNTVAINGMANANPDLVEKGINQLVAQKDLTTEQSEDLKNKLAEQRSLNKDLPENVPEENKQKIKDLIDKRTQLENQLDPEHPDFVDKAYHPDIKEQINGVKKEKADGTTEGKDGINEKIRQLSEPVKSDKDEPLLKSPMDQAKEIISERSKNGMLGGYPSDDPEALLKHIAEQAHGGSMLDDKFISTRQPTEDAFGKDLTDLATKIHPEHIIQEPKAEPEAATGEPSYLLSRHADTIKDEEGKVSGPNEHPLSTEGKKDKNSLANEVQEYAEKTGVPVTKIVHSSLERSKETADGVAEKTGAKTVSDKGLDTWDIGQFDDMKDEEFKKVQKYFVEHPDELEYDGKKLGETFNQYAHRTIDAHAKYENEPASTMLVDHSNNMMIMDAYRKNGGVWDDKAAQDYLNTKKPEPATLVNNKNKQNAVREQTASEVRLRDETAVGAEMGGRNTEHQESTGQANKQPNTEEKSKTEGEKEPRTVGVSHQSLKDIADKIGLEQPKEGDILSPKEYSDRGQALLKAGADPDRLESDFKKDGLVNADRISVARAQYNKLVKDASDAYENNGKNSLEYQKAKAKADQWQKEVLKPMITKGFAETGRASQGETDIDTGSFVSMSRAFEDKYGKEPTPAQAKELEEASKKVKDLTSKVTDLEQKLTEAIDKNVGSGKEKATYKEKAKAYADAFRKLKTKPFTFKDSNGNDIGVTKMGTGWNDIVEFGAKAIEKTGDIADGIAAVVDKIKDADWYKVLTQDDKDKFATQLQSHYEENAPEIAIKDLGERFSDKTDSKFDPKDAKDIWQYAKENYLHKGSTFDDMINGVGTDLGLTNQQVRDAITSPKSARVISDQMYEQQYRQQQAIRDANIVLKTANQSKFERNYVVKFVKSLPSVWFTLKTFGHGTVGFVTHSGMNIFTPSKWGTFWHNFAKQFKFAFGGTTKRGLAAYQQEMTDLIHRPQFTFWKRNGLAVDPVKSYDDYQQFAKGVAKLGEMGDRGFNALKLQRYDLAEMYYNRLSDVEKSDPQTAKNIASIVNHSTGTADIPVPKLIGTAIFAPRLEASRWSRLAMEPGKAVKTLYNWKEASPADKVAAKIVGKRAGEMFATYMSALAANSAALTIAGSAQKINYTDPTQSDWLKFKAGDKTLDISGGMLSAMHFVGSLMKESIGQRKMVRGVPEPRSETMEKTVGGYVRGKLSPIASTVADVTSQADFTGRPLPFSSDKGTKYKPQYTWGEYIEDQQLPIPVSEGFKIVHDQMRDRGMDEATANQIFNGIFSGVASGATGARVGTDYSNDKHEAKTESKQKFHP